MPSGAPGLDGIRAGAGPERCARPKGPQYGPWPAADRDAAEPAPWGPAGSGTPCRASPGNTLDGRLLRSYINQQEGPFSQAEEVNLATPVVATLALAAAELVLAEAPMENPAQPEENIGVYWADEPVTNQQQLEEKVSRYWAAVGRGDYRAVYDMFSPDARSMISYPEWLSMLGLREEEPESSEYELVSAVIEGIRRTDDPNFSHLFEVFTHLRIRAPDGASQEGVQSSLWELADDGQWYPSLPVMAGP